MAAALPPLRFLTCGSVDDGKSTLIGRLLFESRQIHDDHLEALTRDSRRFGTTGEKIDFALALDGLEAEREQGITIDIAHRYFATPARSFVVVDSPGHERYTRNMATGASNCDLAIVLVDVRKGIVPQTRRHTLLCALMGIRHVVLAVNKCDLVGFDERQFETAADAFRSFVRDLGFADVTAIPISALEGGNLVARAAAADWYTGPTLLEHLESVDVQSQRSSVAFRMPVQLVLRPDAAFRGYAGRIAAGGVAIGDRVAVARTGETAGIVEIRGPDGPVARAAGGDAVVLRIDADLDVSRGDLLAAAADRPHFADQFEANIVWFDEAECLPGRKFAMRIGTKWTMASVTRIKHRLDIETLDRSAARSFAMNDIGVVNIELAEPVGFDSFADCRRTGSFVLVDPQTCATAGAGMINHPLRRATNVVLESGAVSPSDRAAALRQTPRCIWFTGLSGSGKSTIAKALELTLHRAGRHAMLIDGDNLRHGLNRDLGFTEADRIENIRRAGHLAKLLVDAGLIAIFAFISPYKRDRDDVRALFASGSFVEVFVDTPISECERRDAKGLYAKARAGLIPNFTGVSAPYEPPESPEIHLQFAGSALDESTADAVAAILKKVGM